MSRFKLATLITICVCLVSVVLPSPLNYGLAGMAILGYLGLIGLGVLFIRMNFFQEALCFASPDHRHVALTFDDGPEPETTERVLDILAEHSLTATFFCVGELVRQYPSIIKRIVAEGHEIGNHTMHHRWYTNFLFGKTLKREIEDAQKAISDVSGIVPTLFRPPMGLMNPHFRTILDSLDLTLTGWTVRSLDLNSHDAHAVLRRVTQKVRPGSILLMHDAGQSIEFIDEFLTGLIQHIQKEDLQCLSVSSLQASNGKIYHDSDS